MTLPTPEDTFRQEAAELLESLEVDLLLLDGDPTNMDVTDSAFRALHTLKGSGAMFGFTAVASFVHGFETIFDRVRKGELQISSALVSLALEAKDHIAALVSGQSEENGGPLLSRLSQFGVSEAAPVQTTTPGTISAGRSCTVRFRLPGNALLNGTNPGLLLEELRFKGASSVTALVDAVPTLDLLDPEQLYLGWSFALQGTDPEPLLDDVFMFLRDETEIEVVTTAEPVAESAIVAPVRESPPAEPRASAPEAAADIVRVDANRLDDLMDRIGELVISQARLSQIAHQSDLDSLKAATEDMERLIGGLRDTTMGIRMMPIENIYSRFRRLVRDLSADLGKDIRLETLGGDTELDKSVIDRLADPIVHLIRNSLDHGLEPADVRVAAGKPAQGVVTLSASYSGTEVAISITDDGRGLSLDRIRSRAVEAGLMAEGDKLSDAQIYNFIFAAGFSTAAQVTALSGRGVGMDVVKRTVEDLRGRIELKSEIGVGTTATLRLPLTLAIIDGMHVRVGEERYVIPLSAVVECVEVPENAAPDLSILDVRGTIVALVSLRREFHVPGEPAAHQKIVIVTCADGAVGLIVDQILGNAQTVVKQLSKLHAGIRSFSGATILGDGNVSLIIDPVRLVDGAMTDSANVVRAA